MFAVNFNKTTMPIFWKSSFDRLFINIKTTLSYYWFCSYDGALHDGHLSLMQRSLQKIHYGRQYFVNQRSSTIQDLLKYPHTLEED
jgi:pantothenate synthetase